MIEAEAKTKWCPLVHIRTIGDSMRRQGQEFQTGNPDVDCIASACMAWRWSRAKETAAYLQAVQERMKSTGENFNVATNKVYAEIGSTFEKTEGYCGAFGEPK